MTTTGPPVAAGRVRSTKVTAFPFTFQTELKTHSPPQNTSLAAHGLLLAVVRRDLGAKSFCSCDLTFFLVRVGHIEEFVLVL